MRAALIHVLGDFLQSVGVLISSIIIKINPDYKIADPICTILFAIIVFFTTFTILKDALNILMEGTPDGLSYEFMKKDLLKISGVSSLHDLQIWCISVDKMAVMVHLKVPKEGVDKTKVLHEASRILKEVHKVVKAAVQIDEEDPYFESKCKCCQENL